MKLMQQHRSVGMSDGMTSTVFGMEVSAKAFQILIAKLYSDRIRAVIREISTNAYDSHIANGNANEPFLVHLPTFLEPTFWVRDFGTGLSDEEINSVYFTVFRSSKTEDENSTGCLGLGSKSPLTYTDSFMVESYQDGKRNVYAVHYNDENLPVATPMGSFDTDERNGIKVSVSVQSGDCSVFTNKAREIFRHFAVKPTIIGAECVIPEKTPILSGDGWALFEQRTSGIVMSNVHYPLRADSQYFEEDQNALINHYGIELYFENGKVSFEPSRENLSYDKPTIHAIKTRLDTTLEAIIKATQDELNACPNLFEARKKYFEIVSKNPSIENFKNRLKYKNLKFIAYGSNTWFSQIDKFGGTKNIINVRELTFMHTRAKEWSINSNFKIDANLVLIDLDDEKFWKKKVRSKYYENGNNKIFLFRFKDDDERQTVYALFGCDDSYLVKTSSLPLPPKGVSTGTNFNSVAQVNLYKEHSLTSHCWTPEEVDFEDFDGIYVEILSGRVIFPNGVATHAKEISEVLRYLKDLGCAIPNIYGIKKKSISEVKEYDNWTTLWEYIKKCVSDYIVANKLEDVMRYLSSPMSYSTRCAIRNLEIIANKLPITHEVSIIAQEKNKKDEYETKFNSVIDAINNLKRLCQFDVNIAKLPVFNFEKMLESIDKKYILLTKIAESTYNMQTAKYKKHCLFYINQVDKEMK